MKFNQEQPKTIMQGVENFTSKTMEAAAGTIANIFEKLTPDAIDERYKKVNENL